MGKAEPTRDIPTERADARSWLRNVEPDQANKRIIDGWFAWFHFSGKLYLHMV